MTNTNVLPSLSNIQEDLNIVISQVNVFNLYVDHEIEDKDFSNCLIDLKNSLTDIRDRLFEYRKVTDLEVNKHD